MAGKSSHSRTRACYESWNWSEAGPEHRRAPGVIQGIAACADNGRVRHRRPPSRPRLTSLTVVQQTPGLGRGRQPVYRIPGYRVALLPDATAASARRPVVSTRAGWARLIGSYYAALAPDREVLLVVLLSTRCRVLGISVVAVGALNCVYAPMREVLKAAALAGASSVVVAHNHPSEEPEPSEEDRDISRRLIAAGNALGIRVLDHLVLGEGGRWRSVPPAPDPTPAASPAQPGRPPQPAGPLRPVLRTGAQGADGRVDGTGARAMAMVHLDARRMGWLQKQGDDFGATLGRLVDAEIRRVAIKKAVADEHDVEMLIRRHRNQLERRLMPAKRLWTREETELSRQIDDQADREILAACASMEDPNMRAAAERVTFKRLLDRGEISNEHGRGRQELQRLRERRPGGWE